MDSYALASLLVLLPLSALVGYGMMRWIRVFSVPSYEFQPNERVEKMLADQSPDAELTEMDVELVPEPEVPFMQAPLVPLPYLARFMLLRSLNRYSIIGVLAMRNRMQFSMEGHIASVLAPLILYGLLGVSLSNELGPQMYGPFIILVMVASIINVIAINHSQGENLADQLKRYKASLVYINKHLPRMLLAYPNTLPLERRLEGQFQMQVGSQLNRYFIQLRQMTNRRKIVQSSVIAATIIPFLVLASMITSIHDGWMFYGILLGTLMDQITRLLGSAVMAAFQLKQYLKSKDPEITRILISYMNQHSVKTSQINSPTRKSQDIKDRNSPLKYLIAAQDDKSGNTIEIKPMPANYEYPSESENQQQQSVQKKVDASQWDDMNSGDNLIPIVSEPRELNEFNIDESRERDLPMQAAPGFEIILKSHSGRKTQLEPLSDLSMKKLPPVSKLPPVKKPLRKENRHPDESPEEMKLVKVAPQEPLRELDNLQELKDSGERKNTQNTRGSFRKSVYKTSMEEEDQSYQQSRKINIRSQVAQRYEEQFPQSQTILLPTLLTNTSQSKTIDLRSDNKRGRAESLHTDRKSKKTRTNQIHSVEIPNQTQMLPQIEPPPDDQQTRRLGPARKMTKRMKELAKIYDQGSGPRVIVKQTEEL